MGVHEIEGNFAHMSHILIQSFCSNGSKFWVDDPAKNALMRNQFCMVINEIEGEFCAHKMKCQLQHHCDDAVSAIMIFQCYAYASNT